MKFSRLLGLSTVVDRSSGLRSALLRGMTPLSGRNTVSLFVSSKQRFTVLVFAMVQWSFFADTLKTSPGRSSTDFCSWNSIVRLPFKTMKSSSDYGWECQSKVPSLTASLRQLSLTSETIIFLCFSWAESLICFREIGLFCLMLNTPSSFQMPGASKSWRRV